MSSVKITLAFARQLQALVENESIPGSSFNQKLLKLFMDEGILQIRTMGRTHRQVYLARPASLANFLKNRFMIENLEEYITYLEKPESTGKEAVEAAGDTKHRKIRSFEGFLINCYQEIPGKLDGAEICIKPMRGFFYHIHDYRQFLPATEVTVIGIENPENFRRIEEQKHLFEGLCPLFVSRYPQSGDLVNWLSSIPNPYLHYGDFDLSGLAIYLREFKNRLGDQASFFVPSGIMSSIEKYGNRELYERQFQHTQSVDFSQYPEISALAAQMHNAKKCLEQQFLIGERVQ